MIENKKEQDRGENNNRGSDVPLVVMQDKVQFFTLTNGPVVVRAPFPCNERFKSAVTNPRTW